MAKNKYPEETIQKIMEVSERLFAERGFDNVSISDIVTEMGNVTKGAVYGHFKSKDEIYKAIIEKSNSSISNVFETIIEDNSLNGLQKLKQIFHSAFEHSEDMFVYVTKIDFRKNPKLFTDNYFSIVTDDPERIFVPAIEEGMADGSIDTQYPKELAGLLCLILNYWISPQLSDDYEAILKRFEFFDYTLRCMNIQLFDDELKDDFVQHCKMYIPDTKYQN